MTAGFDAFIVVLREGIEALLVIGALAAALRRSGANDRVREIWIGAVLAALASLGMAWVFAAYFGREHDDLAEGVVMAVAALLLFYISGWLYVRQELRAWQAALARQVEAAVAVENRGPSLLGAIGFLAVFREGAETVLFLQAQATAAGGWNAATVGGIGAGLVALGIVYYLLDRAASRLPLRPVFLVTSVLLFVMGIRFVGQSLREFQEMGWVPFNEVSLPGWIEAAGLNPSLEALGLQGALIAAAILGALVLRNRTVSAAV